MDPVTIGAVLLAVAGGAGGAAGTQLWSGIGRLVRRPLRPRIAAGHASPALPTGQAELAALEQVPADERRALALAKVLVARAAADADFRRALEGWWEEADPIRAAEGNVTNTISGGIQLGPVVQGRDFGSLTFGPVLAAPPPGPPSSDEGT